jgi:prevent-host-death family protein
VKAELLSGPRERKNSTASGRAADERRSKRLECSYVPTYDPSGNTADREAQTMVTSLTSREFNHDTSGAKKAASRGPVFITDRGRPAHVLLTIEDYLRLTGGHMSLAEALGQAETDFDFDPPRVAGRIFKPADLD